jgi:hypothetical protein
MAALYKNKSVAEQNRWTLRGMFSCQKNLKSFVRPYLPLEPISFDSVK